jgi:DNA-binding GntR family transcriptional regulator
MDMADAATAARRPTRVAISLAVPDGQADEARTLTSAVQARLRSDIIACRFQPGEKLPIALLGKRFGVSYALVREALSRLVADGLVVAEDQRGFRAGPLSLADLQDLTETRIEIECLALRRSMARGDAAWRDRLQAAWNALRSSRHPPPEAPGEEHEAWSVLHARFHAALVSTCGLDWLMRFRTTLYEQSERYRRMSRMLRGGLPRDVQAEHAQIFRAVMDADTGAAVALLAAHLQRTADDITAAARNQGFGEELPRAGAAGSRWGRGV